MKGEYNMQYLVQTKGEVIIPQEKGYIIEAVSQEDALIIAKQNFLEEFQVANEDVQIQSFKNRNMNLAISCLFLSISVFLSFINWSYGHEIMSIRPNMISTIYAVFLYMAFIIRFKDLKQMLHSPLDMVVCVLIILIFAALIQPLLLVKSIPFFIIGDIPFDANIMIPIAIVLSWLGLGAISGIIYPIIFILGICNIFFLNKAIGIWGPIFILSIFLGMLFYISTEPQFYSMKSLFSLSMKKGVTTVKSDMNETGQATKKLKHSAENIVKKTIE